MASKRADTDSTGRRGKERVLVDVGFGVKDHAGREFSKPPSGVLGKKPRKRGVVKQCSPRPASPRSGSGPILPGGKGLGA